MHAPLCPLGTQAPINIEAIQTHLSLQLIPAQGLLADSIAMARASPNSLRDSGLQPALVFPLIDR